MSETGYNSDCRQDTEEFEQNDTDRSDLYSVC